MAFEKKIIEDAVSKMELVNFLKKELKGVGFSDAIIQSTPIATRIVVKVQKPGRVIGKKGGSIQNLINLIKDRFNIQNPLIDVVSVDSPYLDPTIVANRLKIQIESGKRVRRLLYSALRAIMRQGAVGAEILVKGKIVGKSGRARALRVTAGYLPKAGEPANYVKTTKIVAYPKSGAVGITVKIVQPGTVFPDKVEIINKVEEDGNIQDE